jgi:hypothetical protein
MSTDHEITPEELRKLGLFDPAGKTRPNDSSCSSTYTALAPHAMT